MFRRRARFIFSSLGLILFGLPSAATVHADGAKADLEAFEQGVCGQTINSSVMLTRDLVDCGENGIVIGADGVVLDGNGHVISGIGRGDGVRAVEHSSVTIRNTTIQGFEKGIHLKSSAAYGQPSASRDNKITANTLEDNRHGVFLSRSVGASITQNRFLGNADSGITLSGSEGKFGYCSDDVTVSGNEFTYNVRGLVIYCEYLPQSGIVVEENTFAHNLVPVTDVFDSEDRVKYRANSFSENLNTVFFRYHGDHLLQGEGPREFDISVNSSDGSECADFVVTRIATTPDEAVTHTRSGHHVTGSFTPRRRGLYSLYIEGEGCGQKRIGQRFWFGREESTTLFMDKGERRDEGYLVSASPPDSGRVWCTMWIQASPREPLVEEGIAKMTRVETALWSNYIDQGYENLRNRYGLEFGRTFSRRADTSVSIDKRYPEARTRITEVLNKGFWVHEPEDWRRLALKYVGRDPEWLTEPAAPSTVTISYLVTEHPLVLKVAGSHAQILSVTSPADSSRSAEIVLTGKGKTSVSVRLDESSRQRVELDGVRCELSEACETVWNGDDVQIQIDATAEHKISIRAAPGPGAKNITATANFVTDQRR